MKKYLVNPARTLSAFTAVAAISIAQLAPLEATAQDASEKIRLMAETLRARDAGNLVVAKEKAEELLRLAPDDQNVQRLNASIASDIERSGQGVAVFGNATEKTEAPEPTFVEPPVEITEAPAIFDDGLAKDMMVAEAEKQEAAIAKAEAAIDEAEKLIDLKAYDEANAVLDTAASGLENNVKTAGVLEDLQDEKAAIIYAQAKDAAKAGEPKAAEELLADYVIAGGSERKAASLASRLDADIRNPYKLDINDISPDYVEREALLRDLLTKGRAQFFNGDYDGAAATFNEVAARDANNPDAKLFSTLIAEKLSEIHSQNVAKTRAEMLTEVDQQWERPKVFDISTTAPPPVKGNNDIARKMNSIVIPQVNFSSMELTRVIDTLSELSVIYDKDTTTEFKGVNLVPLFDANEKNPRVSLSLRNLSLDRILQFVTSQVNFSYDVGQDAVTIQPTTSNGGVATTITEFFPISRGIILRLTGGGSSASVSAGPIDPFAPAAAAPTAGGGADDQTDALKAFFTRAGVNFDLKGSALAYDGEQLIVTQSRRNLERMRSILRNYNEVKQVEIEAKFLEVAQNDLEELGFDWSVSGDSGVFKFSDNGQVIGDQELIGDNSRTVSSAFGGSAASNAISISGEDNVSVASPDITGTIDLASAAGSVFGATGWEVGALDVDFAIRALARKTGSDLMSAPKVTVLSGKRASITVAQELRYPESYGDIESTVSASNSGGSAISITAGTPEDFVTRNVGVELAVTPNVENDDTISLILEPRVTEFEGFVEYGGTSVAVVGTGSDFGVSENTVVTVPAGFYQPVFSTREMTTEVTVFDGATLILGGLTRDEVKTVSDKVPVLGDIPGVGRLFRSEGETRQKRNLLIFVTANLVSPGGSLSRQSYENVQSNALFQNPTVMTPAGMSNRTVTQDQ